MPIERNPAPEASPAHNVLGALFQRHHQSLVRFLSRLTHCPQRAEDLAQLAWLKLLTLRESGLNAIEDESELRAYVFTIARNAFLDEYTRKHESVRTRTVDPSQFALLGLRADDGDDPAVAVARDEVDSIIRGAVHQLSPEQQKVIRMWAEGTSIRDMARAAAAPRDTVLSRKKYAVAHLRSRLSGFEAALC